MVKTCILIDSRHSREVAICLAPTRILRLAPGHNLQSVLRAEICFQLVRKLSSRSFSNMIVGWLTPATCHRCEVVSCRGRTQCRSLRSAFWFLPFGVATRPPGGCSRRRFTAAKRKSGVVALSAHASHQAEALHQLDSNWHGAAGRVSELARGTVPCVDVRVSEIVTASVRDRGTQYQFGGYVRCDVSMSCGKMPPECTCTCHPCQR